MRPELPKDNHILFQSKLGRSSLHQSVQLGYQSIASSGWSLDQNLSSEEMYNFDPTYPQNNLIVTPDTNAYKIFDLVSNIGAQTINGFLYVFGKNQNNLSGIIQLPGQVIPFEKAVMGGGTLQFQNTEGPASVSGRINYTEDFVINGTLSIDGLPFQVDGSLVGGDNVPDGMKLPALTTCLLYTSPSPRD